MGQHTIVRLRACALCGAQETTDAAGMARHAASCEPDQARMVRRRKGLCVDCGKKALPYVKCPRCRFRGRLKRALDRGAAYGLFIKSFREGDRRAYYAIGDEDARVGVRGFYNTRRGGGVPRGFFPFVQAYLQQSGRSMEEEKIIASFTEYRRERARRGHLEVTDRSASVA